MNKALGLFIWIFIYAAYRLFGTPGETSDHGFLDGNASTSVLDSTKLHSNNLRNGDGLSPDTHWSWGDSYSTSEHKKLSFVEAGSAGDQARHSYCKNLQTTYVNDVITDKAQAAYYSNSKLPKANSAERLAKVDALLDFYSREHNVNNLFPHYADPAKSAQRDSHDRAFCKSDRAFILGVYSCPRQVGNRLHEFLNAFAAAVITNRTLVWKFCDRPGCSNTEGECQPFLELSSLAKQGISPLHSMDVSIQRALQNRPWIPNAADVLTRLRNGGCNFPSYAPHPDSKSRDSSGSFRSLHTENNTFERPWRYSDLGRDVVVDGALPDESRAFANGVTQHQLVPHSQYSKAGEAIVACCGIDTLTKHRILELGSLERRELFGVALAGANLGPRARARANILFSVGPSIAYGMLLRRAFQFGPSVEKWNFEAKSKNGLLSEQSDTVSSPGLRRLSRDPVPDDDSPKSHRAVDLKLNEAKKDIRYMPRKSGRQEIPPEALAIGGAGATVVRSPQGTSVGPKAGSSSVLISDSGGENAVNSALRSGAATSDKLKSEKSPEVPLSHLQQIQKNKLPKKVNPRDRWADPAAGNFSLYAELHPEKYQAPPTRAANGISTGEDELVSDSQFHYSVNAAARGAKPSKRDVAESMLKTRHKKSADVAKPASSQFNADEEVNITEDDNGKEEHVAVDSEEHSSTRAYFVLAVHLRHTSSSDTGAVDHQGEIQCIQGMLEAHVPKFSSRQQQMQYIEGARKRTNISSIFALEKALPKLSCLVLIASDRSAAQERVSREVSALGCEVQSSPHSSESVGMDYKPEKGGSEHGPFGGSIFPIADIELLSHADAFIGSADSPKGKEVNNLSTFSLLIASLIASNGRSRQHIQESPSHNILTHEDSYVHWLPSCSSGFSSYYVKSAPQVEPLLASKIRLQSAAHVVDNDGGTWKGYGNGHYESTDCPFFTWNKQCGNSEVMERSNICEMRSRE